jgi:hypothetical protein
VFVRNAAAHPTFTNQCNKHPKPYRKDNDDDARRPFSSWRNCRAAASPGFSPGPFGWAAEPVAAMMRADRSLFADLFAIDRSRMNLIALAVAHLNLPVPPEIGPLLVRASARQVLNQVFGQPPVGLRRTLSHLPDAVLSRAAHSLISPWCQTGKERLISLSVSLSEARQHEPSHPVRRSACSLPARDAPSSRAGSDVGSWSLLGLEEPTADYPLKSQGSGVPDRSSAAATGCNLVAGCCAFFRDYANETPDHCRRSTRGAVVLGTRANRAAHWLIPPLRLRKRSSRSEGDL